MNETKSAGRGPPIHLHRRGIENDLQLSNNFHSAAAVGAVLSPAQKGASALLSRRDYGEVYFYM